MLLLVNANYCDSICSVKSESWSDASGGIYENMD